MTDKAEAKRLADEAGNEIGKSDPQWEVIDAAIEMLRRWPDGEPFCYLRQTSSERNPPHGWAVYFSGQPGDVPAYTAPPDQSERIDALERKLAEHGLAESIATDQYLQRIAVLEAALEQRDKVIEAARVALEWARDLNEIARRSNVIDKALRKIREVLCG